MIWKKHKPLEQNNNHAFLSPSKAHWIYYDDEKLIAAYNAHSASALGTRLHALAAELIDLGVKLKNVPQTLNMFVNDAIDFNMIPEQLLWYSHNSFGTADAVSFNEKKSELRIHDMKSGTSAGKMEQLDIYAALFCLEYQYMPRDITILNRLYQKNEILKWSPKPDKITDIMDRTVYFDKLIQNIQRGTHE